MIFSISQGSFGFDVPYCFLLLCLFALFGQHRARRRQGRRVFCAVHFTLDGASTGERIAVAFVLNRMEFLPASYSDAVKAWDRLDTEWQDYVRRIKRDYQHKLVPW
jgi:hypothetical protein